MQNQWLEGDHRPCSCPSGPTLTGQHHPSIPAQLSEPLSYFIIIIIIGGGGYSCDCFSSVQSLSHIRLFVTPWTAAHQASLSITSSRKLLKLMSIKSVIPSNHLILCHPLLLLPSVFPSIRVFSMCQFFTSGGQSIGASASAPVLPMNIQD